MIAESRSRDHINSLASTLHFPNRRSRRSRVLSILKMYSEICGTRSDRKLRGKEHKRLGHVERSLVDIPFDPIKNTDMEN